MRTILLLLSLVFLPFSAFATNSCITNNNTPNPGLVLGVRDTDGNPLNKTHTYEILLEAGGGGVVLANLGDQEDCPTSVVESLSDGKYGKPVYFTPKDPRYDMIVEYSSVNINFYLDTNLCFNYTVWKVDNYPKPRKHYTISTGAKLGNPLDVNSWFQIKALTAGPPYKLVFCPYGEEFTCHNVGIFYEKGYGRLVLSDTPVAFKFKLHKGLGMATE